MRIEENPQMMNGLPPPVAMLQLITGGWISQIIYVAAKLGIADLLATEAKSVDELAGETGVEAKSLYRVLRALASLGIFAEGESRRFKQTPGSSCLQSEVQGSMRAMAILFGEDWHYRPWGDVLHSVSTGQSAFKHSFGLPLFPYLAQDEVAAKVFDEAMTSGSAPANDAIAAACDFPLTGELVDIGGGHGSLIRTFLRLNPKLQGTLFDQPSVIEGARPHFEAAQLAERCKLVGGNFFESVPAGGDAYLLKFIIHDWDDEAAIKILSNIRRAVTWRVRILVVENVIPAGNRPSFGKLQDVEMLVITGGRERTEAEFRILFDTAGFKLTRVIATKSSMSIVEGVKV